MIKRIISVVAIFALLLAIPVFGQATTAEQSEVTLESKTYGQLLEGLGVEIRSYDSYQEDQYLTRVDSIQLIKLFVDQAAFEKFVEPEVESYEDLPSFIDGYKLTEYLLSEGVVRGIDDKNFGTNNWVTASDFAFLITKTLGSDFQGVTQANAYGELTKKLNIKVERIKDPNQLIIRDQAFELMVQVLKNVETSKYVKDEKSLEVFLNTSVKKSFTELEEKIALKLKDEIKTSEEELKKYEDYEKYNKPQMYKDSLMEYEKMLAYGTKYLQGNVVELSLAEGYELVKDKDIEFVASEVDLVTDQRLLDMDIFTTGIQSKISLRIYENQKFSINVFSTEGVWIYLERLLDIKNTIL